MALAVAFTLVAWGGWRGAVRAFGALVVLLLALELAPALAPRLEHPLAQAAGVSTAHLPAASWALALVALLVLAGVLASAFRGWLPPTAFPRPISRWIGALLGAMRALVLILVVAQLLIEARLLVRDPAALRDGSRLLAALAPLRAPAARLFRLPPASQP